MKRPLIAGISALCAVTAAICLWPAGGAPAPARVEPKAAPARAEAPQETVDLALAMEEKSVVAEFSGNSREQLRVAILNKGTSTLKVTIPVGQVFESDTAAPVVVVHPGLVEVAPGRTRELVLATAATRSSNTPAQTAFRLSYSTLPLVAPTLLKAQEHPELTLRAIQTAVLAITENLPLSAVAQFTLAASPLPSRFNTDAYRVETLDILSALDLLREAGVREATMALTIDPQLKIEAMIDPVARPLAMRYYGIEVEREWEFWRGELLNGEPSTRHYALYGIARFYPDVALQMLPRWARETRTNPVYRLAAVQALADTERSEALPVLRNLGKEFGPVTELGRAATGAADYLDYQLTQNLAARRAVAFQNNKRGAFGSGNTEPKLVVASN